MKNILPTSLKKQIVFRAIHLDHLRKPFLDRPVETAPEIVFQIV